LALMPEGAGAAQNELFSQQALPSKIIQKIKNKSWKTPAPIKLEDLAYLKITYFGFDGKPHLGCMIVHKKVAKEVLEIFQGLYRAKFPIEKIALIDDYGADDNRSMSANNSSALCVRPLTGEKHGFSRHSYGLAIDINPLQNPYVKGKTVSPAAGKNYLDRTKPRQGMIIKGDVCYNAFIARGWQWGGEWKSLKDYQHFEK
jgi:D-alanyl-D-alanine carboxypeptidase